MGYFLHETMVVSHDFDTALAKEAHAVAVSIFAKYKLESLISNIVLHCVNGGAAFFISPDGSKEGWDPSERGKTARTEFIDWLKASPAYYDWALITLGGDDSIFEVTKSPVTT